MLRTTLSALGVALVLTGCGARSALEAGAPGTGGQSTAAGFPALCDRYATLLANAGEPACGSCISTLGSVSGPCVDDFGGVVQSTGPCADVNVCLGSCDGTVCGCLETCLDGNPSECTDDFATLYTCLLGQCGAACGA
jgi:hypothetical protein